MKYFILFISLWGLSLCGYVCEIDSLTWGEAEQEMQSGNYEKACSLYIDLCGQLNAAYSEINSRKVEDLRKIYSVDEQELHNNIQENRLLYLCWTAGLLRILVFVGSFSI